MKNPILQMLNKTKNTSSNQINSILQATKGNPTGMFNQLMQTNPQFAEFVKKNKDKTPQQIAKDYGIDLSKLNGILR